MSELTSKVHWCGQFDKGDVVGQSGRVPGWMDGVFSSDDGNLRRLGYSSVVGAKKKAEHCGRIGAVSGRQNPVGRDESTSAEAVSIDGDGHLPIIFINTILL